MNLQATASNILQRAVELENKKRYTEALVCYQEGLQVLIDVMKTESSEKRSYLRSKIQEYMNRAEKIKVFIENVKDEGKFHEQIDIENNSTGHSYESIFGRFLTEDVEEIKIEDPYIRTFYQCQNLVRLSELVVKKCKNLKKIQLLTVKNGGEQESWLRDITSALKLYNVEFSVIYSETLHDRMVSLSSGWIIKIGRGLDYFKAPETKFSLGVYDLDLRRCHETTVDIFHSEGIKKTTSN